MEVSSWTCFVHIWQMLGCIAEILKRDMHPVLLAMANLLLSLGWKCRSKTAYGRDTFCTNDLLETVSGICSELYRVLVASNCSSSACELTDRSYWGRVSTAARCQSSFAQPHRLRSWFRRGGRCPQRNDQEFRGRIQDSWVVGPERLSLQTLGVESRSLCIE